MGWAGLTNASKNNEQIMLLIIFMIINCIDNCCFLCVCLCVRVCVCVMPVALLYSTDNDIFECKLQYLILSLIFDLSSLSGVRPSDVTLQ